MYKLLVVDDEPTIADGIAHTVCWGSIGVSVVGCAYSGNEALELVRELRPDIIITDVKMDGIDGLTLVNEASRLFPFVKFIILSGYDEPEYIRRSLDMKVFSYLLKPAGEEELLSVVGQQIGLIESERRLGDKIRMIDNELEKNHHLFLSNFLGDLIDGAVDDNDDFVSRCGFLQVSFSQRYYCCAVFSVPGSGAAFQDSGFHSPQSRVLAIEEILKNTWPGEVWPIRPTQNRLVVILGSDEVQSGLEQAADAVTKFLGTPVLVSAGEPCGDIMKIWISYKQAQLAYEGYNMPEEPGIITINEVSGSPGSRFIYPTEKENRLLSYCFQADHKQSIDVLLDDYFASMEQQGCTIERMRMEFFVFLALIARKASDIGLGTHSDKGLVLPDVYFQLQNCATRTELEEHLRQTIESIRTAISEGQEKNAKAKITKAKQFLYSNFCSCDMSLESISAYMQMNPSYFSRFYKKETGKNFIEALTNMRLEKAKSLLSTTNMRVADISLEIGYQNSKYFWNIFKKTFGCSPSEFRQSSMPAEM